MIKILFDGEIPAGGKISGRKFAIANFLVMVTSNSLECY